MMRDPNPYQILVVEDNPGDFILIADFLEEKMSVPRIIRARTFKEGQRVIADKGAGIQVILLDLSLPDKSGEELISEMIEASGNIPLIVLTGYSDIQFSVKSLSLGASDYLVKDELSASSLYKSILYSVERKRHSMELKDSERRYSELFHLSPQPMWVDDLETLQFLNVNVAAINNYGYSREEFLGMSVMDIIPDDEVSRVQDAARRSVAAKGLLHHGNFRHRKKNGEIIFVDIQSNMINFQGREARVVLANDVTERINHISAIEQQNEKLREIAWTQSHLVRAPLTRMMGIVDILKNFNTGERDRTDLLDHLISSSYELDVIIRKITKQTESIDSKTDHES